MPQHLLGRITLALTLLATAAGCHATGPTRHARARPATSVHPIAPAHARHASVPGAVANAHGLRRYGGSVRTPAASAPGLRGQLPLFLPGSTQRKLVRFTIVDGVARMEGDIRLGRPEELMLRYGRPRPARRGAHHANTVNDDSYLWPQGVIPYTLDDALSASQREDVEWAVRHVNTTELQLRPRTANDEDYVVFIDDGPDCSSYVGRIGGAQTVHIGGCNRGSIPHEILHAAGFFHEHNRHDRDQHVTIHWDEISPGFEDNFHKSADNGQDIGPYDYRSIMHYSRHAFSQSGRPTITPAVADAPIGQFDELSRLDRLGITQLYAHAAPTPPLPTTPTWPAPLPGWPTPSLELKLPPIPGMPPMPELPWLSINR